MDATRDSTLAGARQAIADLQRQLAECTAERDAALAREAVVAAERDEGLEQQAATAEVLRIINSSPGDLAPVFATILEKALHLCEANFGSVYARNGEHIERVASRGMPPEVPLRCSERRRSRRRLVAWKSLGTYARRRGSNLDT